MSCLDDYHLFTKLKKEEKFVCEHWKRRVDISLRKYNYFLLLIHPQVMSNHFSAYVAKEALIAMGLLF